MGVASITPVVLGTLASRQPTTARPAKTVPGAYFARFSDDFYHRVHYQPRRIDVGMVTDAYTARLYVWNSHFESMVLTAVSLPAGAGIVLSGATVGRRVGALEEIEIGVVFDASLATTPDISGDIVLTFGAEVIRVPVSGTRLQLFPWRPAGPLTEILEWRTDVLESHDGTEQRIRLRDVPRRTLKLAAPLRGQAMALAERMVHGGGARTWGAPVWTDAERLDRLDNGATSVPLDASRGDYRVGQYLLVWSSETRYEAALITGVRSGAVDIGAPLGRTYDRPWVMPIVFADLREPAEIDRFTTPRAEIRASFLSTDGGDLSGAADMVYAGYEVLAGPLLSRSGKIARRLEQLVEILDCDTGRTRALPRVSWPVTTLEYRWTVRGRADTWALRQWLHRRAGALVPFWLPTWTPDLEIIGETPAGAVDIRVSPGYRAWWWSSPLRKHFAFVLPDDSLWCRQVTAVQTGADGSETLSLSAPFAITVGPSTFKMVSCLPLCRLAGDRAELVWSGSGRLDVAVGVKEVVQ